MRWRTILVAGILGTTACGGSGSSEPEVTAPPPTAPPTDATASTTLGTTTIASTTIGPSEESTTSTTGAENSTTSASPTTTEPDSDRYLPDGVGTVVDSAPGVDSPGEVTELIENVWFFVPSEPVDGDANVVPPLPEDREILIAYAEAQAAYHEQASMNPVPAEPGPRLAAAIADGGQRLTENVLAPAATNGTHLDLSDGIVLRPVVIADPRSDTEAFIFDCQLDGTVFVADVDGSLADDQVPGVKEFPQIASVVKRDGEWIVDRLTRDERACA